MDSSMPGFPVFHYLPEFAQTHVHWVSDAIQPSPLCHSLLLLPLVFPSIRVFWIHWELQSEIRLTKKRLPNISDGDSFPFSQTVLKLFCSVLYPLRFIVWWPTNSTVESQINKRKETQILLVSYVHTAATAKSLQLCPTLCDPIDGSPPGSPVPGILQARTLEWVAIAFSNSWKWKVKVKSLSHVQFLATPWTAAYQAPLPMRFSRQEYWSGVPSPSPSYVHRSSQKNTWNPRRHLDSRVYIPF